MFIKIADKMYNSDIQSKTNLDVLEFINEKLREDNLVPVEIIIDGKTIEQDYEVYLLNQLVIPEAIEIIAVSKNGLFNEMLNSAKSYLEQSIPQIQNLVDEFYAGPKSETWNRFKQFIEALQWLMSFTQELAEQDTELNPRGKSDFPHQLKVIIQSLSEAVRSSDAIQIGDIIQYEILTLFIDLQQHLQQNAVKEVMKNDLN